MKQEKPLLDKEALKRYVERQKEKRNCPVRAWRRKARDFRFGRTL